MKRAVWITFDNASDRVWHFDKNPGGGRVVTACGLDEDPTAVTNRQFFDDIKNKADKFCRFCLIKIF